MTVVNPNLEWWLVMGIELESPTDNYRLIQASKHRPDPSDFAHMAEACESHGLFVSCHMIGHRLLDCYSETQTKPLPPGHSFRLWMQADPASFALMIEGAYLNLVTLRPILESL